MFELTEFLLNTKSLQFPTPFFWYQSVTFVFLNYVVNPLQTGFPDRTNPPSCVSRTRESFRPLPPGKLYNVGENLRFREDTVVHREILSLHEELSIEGAGKLYNPLFLMKKKYWDVCGNLKTPVFHFSSFFTFWCKGRDGVDGGSFYGFFICIFDPLY